MRISDWSSDVCSSDLAFTTSHRMLGQPPCVLRDRCVTYLKCHNFVLLHQDCLSDSREYTFVAHPSHDISHGIIGRSEEHTSELQSLMRISYAVFCLKKKKNEHSHYRKHTLLHKEHRV